MEPMKYLKYMAYAFLALCVGCSDGENGQDIPDVPEVPAPKPDPEEKPNEEVIPAHNFPMGALFSFQKNLRNGVDAAKGGTSSTTFYNQPLFEAKEFGASEEDWWDNLVEEMVYSGLDYVLPNCRGRLPKADVDPKYEIDHGDPTRIKDFIAALQRRGEESLKIAIFDDCPASWAAARNFDLYGKYTAKLGDKAEDAYPVGDLDAIYKYIWDYNIRLAFDNFYGNNQGNNKYLFRFNGKPVLFLWSVNGFLNVTYGGVRVDCTDKLKAILDKIHADFKQRYNEDVFICADRAFVDRDKMASSAVDALNDWFVASEQTSQRNSFSLRSFKGVNVGVAVPGFLTNDISGNRMLFDAEHGERLKRALDYFIKYEANLVLLEGFTDMAENASYWRSTDTKYYDYPNQRLNMLRKYSNNPYPKEFRVEVEACDSFEDKSAGNSGGQYRKGNLDVAACDDTLKGWCVTDTEAGEWMKWVELPFRSGKSVIKLRYASKGVAKVRMDIDGKEGTSVELPSTSGKWQEADIATVSFDRKGWREVVLRVVSGSADLNCFTIVAE